jgi:hypothetical protein
VSLLGRWFGRGGARRVPARPHRNCYWVEPGRLLAGEYPGAPDEETTRRRLGAYLDAGIREFVDLTEPREVTPYEARLRNVAAERGVRVGYHRLPIRDMSVPRNPRDMHRTLDTLERLLEAPDPVYLHCLGGVGRTGLVVGCWLVRRGHSAEEALLVLADWWRGVEKSLVFPETPQTEAQRRWVLDWPKSETSRRR